MFTGYLPLILPGAFVWGTWYLRWKNPDAPLFVKITGWLLSAAWHFIWVHHMIRTERFLASAWSAVAVGLSLFAVMLEMAGKFQVRPKAP